MQLTKSGLAIILGRLKDFDEHILELEQYSTPSEIAADVCWRAFMNSDVKGKVLLDPACGPGFLGIATLFLEAKRVYFVDLDKRAIDILRKNIEFIKKNFKIKNLSKRIVIKNIDIKEFSSKVDTVIQNPPFGVKIKHADRGFLQKAFEVANIIYSFHKVESKNFIEKISRDNNFKITHFWPYDFELRATQRYHKKRIHRIGVGCWRLERIDL